MKFLNYLQFVLCLMAYLCVLALVIKNIAIGAIGIKGIPLASLFLILMGLIVLFSWAEIKGFNDGEKTLRR